MLTQFRSVALFLILLIVACGPSPEAVETDVIVLPTSVEHAAETEAPAQVVVDTAEEVVEPAEVVINAPADKEQVVADDTDSAEFPENRPILIAKVGTQETYGDGIEVGFTEDGHAYIGDITNAPVVIEEFSDFQCPFCSRFFTQTMGELLSAEIASGQTALVFYDFPLSIHAQAPAASNAARCAGDQGAVAYWEMHDQLFKTLGQWSTSDPNVQFISYGENIGLDTEAFSTCLTESSFADMVQADFAIGSQRGVRGTPSFYINGQFISGAQPYAIFQQAIAGAISGEAVVQAAPPSPSAPAVNPADIQIERPEAFELSDNFAGAIGDPNAPVTIVEFTDFQCPFCSRHTLQTMPALLTDYIETGRVYYIMKDLPLDQLHPFARDGAAAARCAGQQDLFWEMHDVLFGAQPEWSKATDITVALRGYASELNLDMDAYDTCFASQEVRDAIEANVQEAQSVGISGTPFFFVDGFPVINGAQPIEAFNQVIGLAEDGELVNAIMDAQRRQLAAQQQQGQPEQQQAPPAPTGPVDVEVGDAFAIGDPDAPVVVIEYTDYQCPYCSRHHSETFSQIVTDYIDKGLVYYVFKDYPLNFHPQAESAAVAARCAGEQDQFLEMHGMLFDQQGAWSGNPSAADTFAGYADTLSLDGAAFDTCRNNPDIVASVRADLAEGAALGVRGTPAFFVNGQLISGAQPYQVFQQMFDAQINQ